MEHFHWPFAALHTLHARLQQLMSGLHTHMHSDQHAGNMYTNLADLDNVMSCFKLKQQVVNELIICNAADQLHTISLSAPPFSTEHTT